ncbi:MAG: dihydroorotate dehydrogenase [Bacteroidales bacterium]
MVNLNVQLHKLKLKNPIMTASGTFGYGTEFDDFIRVSDLGGIVVKGTTGKQREGNPYPRMAETPMGMLNAVGLQNVGVDKFITDIYPGIKDYDTNVLVNVSGSTIEEYLEVAEKINALDKIPGIELNISCPNVKKGGMAFGTSCPSAKLVVEEVRKVYDKTLIVKLSPNVTDIVEIARAVTQAGADALALINTLMGMAIDAEKQSPVLSTVTGGLSGPAIKPVALRMLWQVAREVDVPLIGMGGIRNATDVVEFLLAGATAVEIGTANFIDPAVTIKCIDGLKDYMKRHAIKDVNELTGALK